MSELDEVRRKLEGLASARLCAPLDTVLQAEYERLCAREAQLLTRA